MSELNSAPEKNVAKENKKERGASMVEYALVIGLIAVICIVAVRILGQNVSKQFSNVAAQL